MVLLVLSGSCKNEALPPAPGTMSATTCIVIVDDHVLVTIGGGVLGAEEGYVWKLTAG